MEAKGILKRGVFLLLLIVMLLATEGVRVEFGIRESEFNGQQNKQSCNGNRVEQL